MQWLKQQMFIFSLFLWVGNLGHAQLGKSTLVKSPKIAVKVLPSAIVLSEDWTAGEVVSAFILMWYQQASGSHWLLAEKPIPCLWISPQGSIQHGHSEQGIQEERMRNPRKEAIVFLSRILWSIRPHSIHQERITRSNPYSIERS